MPCFRFVFITVIIMTCFSSCQIDTQEQKKRPREVWVIRSVLDRQPRMLTVALDSNCYVAYDVARCTLSKAWKGGIILQGAAYTNQPNLQPVSWGKLYSDKLANTWQVEYNGRKDSFHLINRG